MPEFSSLTSASSQLSGLAPIGGGVLGMGASDTPETGGFQAMLDMQALAAPTAVASDPAVMAQLPPVAIAAAMSLTAIVLPEKDVAGLPDSGKILPPLAGEDTDASETGKEPALLDPALMLMLNPVAQPAAPEHTTQPEQPKQSTASGAPVALAASTLATHPAASAPQHIEASRIAQPHAAHLAVSADASKAAAETMAITIEPQGTKSQDGAATLPQTIEVRPVIVQPRSEGSAPQSGHGQQEHNRNNDSQTTTGTAASMITATTANLVEAPAGPAPASMAIETRAAPLGTATQPQQHSDMASLVDRLVEARQAARMSGPQSVMASISHADFGRVSLDFRQDDKGLSVAMASNDPAFAPAAQTALAQQQVNAANTGNQAGDTASNNQNEQRQHYLAQNTLTQSGTQSGGSSFAGNQSSSGQSDQPRQSHDHGPAANPAQPATESRNASRQSGILA